MIAQLNVAYAVAPLEEPQMSEFVENLDRINALAEESDGFIWRLMDETGNATSIKTKPDPRFIMNLSIWRSVADLHRFVFQTDHKYFVANGAKWFEKSDDARFIMWNIHDDAPYPTPQEALERLAYFNEHGPSKRAFDWKTYRSYL